MGFEEMEPMFGELTAEWPGLPETALLGPFLFLVRALPTETSAISIQVTDFHSNTWEVLKSRSQLEDMRDSIGIGGSWSDFEEYFIASLKSEDVKLIMDGQSNSGGAAYAKLIAQKAKGMPRIIISLAKLVDTAANGAMSILSLELYKAYRKAHNLLIKEEKHLCELTNLVSAEQEKNETLQRQLDTMIYPKKQKFQKVNDKVTSEVISVRTSQDSPDKRAVQIPASTKTSNRVVPAYRRAKVRGVLLKDTEDDPQD
ncbi:hypothetical protein M9H77_12688 [Catharanthus roseus]|uniref:Uncharacterized protein n=1 Tax=Catharanthus roseus TaxID=4058 RepID=A0ACC0BIA0_CATRO|nr:hypothetical protein M9H77_12688 [Catharanthus roseus]